MEPILKSITILVNLIHHQLIFWCRRSIFRAFTKSIQLPRINLSLLLLENLVWFSRKSKVRGIFSIILNPWWTINWKNCNCRLIEIVDYRIVDDFIGFHWDMIHAPCATWTITTIRKKYARRFFSYEDGWNVHRMRKLMFFFFLFSSFSQVICFIIIMSFFNTLETLRRMI